MPHTQKVVDRDYATQVQDRLVELLGGQGAELAEDADGPVAVNVAETYREAGLVPGNPGVILHMSDDADVYLSIAAYVPREARR